MNTEEARSHFAGDKFATQATGITIEAVGDSYAKCILEIADRHLNQRGTVMGGAIFTLADFAVAVASNHEGRDAVSLSSSINYLSVPKGDRLYAEAHGVKDGHKVCVFQVDIYDNLEVKVACALFTNFRPSSN